MVPESEYLFIPYSAFKVLSYTLKDNSTWEHPDEVHLLAIEDPDENLPLFMWN